MEHPPGSAPQIPGITGYIYTEAPVPHHARGRELLERHPEVRALLGRNSWTAAWTFVLVAGQFGVAWLTHSQPWWVALLVAWCVGAFFVQGLFVMVHEAGHQAVFASRTMNHLVVLLASLPMVIPGGESFNYYHALHHAHRGSYELDADIADHWEARLIGGSWWRKSLWMLLYCFF